MNWENLLFENRCSCDSFRKDFSVGFASPLIAIRVACAAVGGFADVSWKDRDSNISLPPAVMEVMKGFLLPPTHSAWKVLKLLPRRRKCLLKTSHCYSLTIRWSYLWPDSMKNLTLLPHVSNVNRCRDWRWFCSGGLQSGQTAWQRWTRIL